MSFPPGGEGPPAGVCMKEQLGPVLKANGCTAPESEEEGSFRPDAVRDGQNYYTQEKGYQSGDRLYTRLYTAADGTPRVGYTVMKNMPHGAIPDESRAAWDFLRHFSRPQGSKTVVYTP